MLYLVRHAKAGSRSTYEGDDRDRPLTDAGRRQAEALAERLAPLAVGALVSSPFTRCHETLAPLASRLGHDITLDDRLAEERGFEGALALLAELPDGSVLCSHGDVIPDTIGALARRGCTIAGEPEWGKASVWVLLRDVADGITRAAAWPPPAV